MTKWACLPLVVLCMIASTGSSRAETPNVKDASAGCAFPQALSQGLPSYDARVHRTNDLLLTVSNFGILGDPSDTIMDPERNSPVPDCEYPAGSGIQYLFLASVWVGAIVHGDTLVSTGHDGWLNIEEMYPDEVPYGDIVKRSNIPTDDHFSEDALSAADYLAHYSDSISHWNALYEPPMPDPTDGRAHIPMEVGIRQNSYSWPQGPFENFVIIDYTVCNHGNDTLMGTCIGFYFDPDIYDTSVAHGGRDDICGSLTSIELHDGYRAPVAWAADADGDPLSTDSGMIYDDRSPLGVFGVAPLSYPDAVLPSFNWWVTSWVPGHDWGPRLAEHDRDWVDGEGTPLGDRCKYYMMSHPESDYDQLWSAVDRSPEWLPPSDSASTLADGSDIRFLLSFGSVDLAPGDSVRIALVVTVGDNFHSDPEAFANLFDPSDPEPFYETLDFSDLLDKIATAKILYDSIMVLSGTPVIDGTENLPERFAVSQNRPNPFNNSTTIEFYLDRPSEVRFEVYNILGEKVWSKDVNGIPGRNVVSWNAVGQDGSELPSGVYLYRLVAGESSATRKMMLLK